MPNFFHWRQKRKEEKLEEQKQIMESIRRKELSKERERIWKEDNKPKYKIKDRFGIWIIIDEPFFDREVYYDISSDYRYCYNCLNIFSGETKCFREINIKFIKELS